MKADKSIVLDSKILKWMIQSEKIISIWMFKKVCSLKLPDGTVKVLVEGKKNKILKHDDDNNSF